MSRRRRATLLLGLAFALGGLAASDVARREAALEQRLGPAGEVIVARGDLPAGTVLAVRHLARRRMPLRYAPRDRLEQPGPLIGQQLAVPVAREGYLTTAMLALPDSDDTATGAPVRKGERVAHLVATGPPDLVVAGARVDVLVTQEKRDAQAGGTRLALQDVEVLDAQPSEGDGNAAAGTLIAADLRVSLDQAVYLAAVQAFASEVRLLPRAAGDRRRSRELAVGEDLRMGW